MRTPAEGGPGILCASPAAAAATAVVPAATVCGGRHRSTRRPRLGPCLVQLPPHSAHCAVDVARLQALYLQPRGVEITPCMPQLPARRGQVPARRVSAALPLCTG